MLINRNVFKVVNSHILSPFVYTYENYYRTCQKEYYYALKWNTMLKCCETIVCKREVWWETYQIYEYFGGHVLRGFQKAYSYLMSHGKISKIVFLWQQGKLQVCNDCTKYICSITFF